ncbi:MAG: hypothetical protein ACKOPG_08705 [Novosphingobium sp.]
MLTALFLILAADAGTAAAAEQPMVEPNPKTMSQKEIRAFNSKLPRSHPYYIRCVASGEVGSLVKKSYSCRTNHQWALAEEKGNQNARDTMEQMASKAANSN